jgi:tetrahydromethanopterin S-methyltransferase subunit B
MIITPIKKMLDAWDGVRLITKVRLEALFYGFSMGVTFMCLLALAERI